jgi:hypothetical protein
VGDMRSALLKAKLVSEDQVKKTEEEKKRQEAAKAAAKLRSSTIYEESKFAGVERLFNRHGKPPAFVAWFVDQKLPKDVGTRCSHCGEVGLDPLAAFARVMDAADTAAEKSISVFDQMTAAKVEAEKIGKTGLLLQATQIGVLHQGASKLFESANEVPMICSSCVRFILKPFGLGGR